MLQATKAWFSEFTKTLEHKLSNYELYITVINFLIHHWTSWDMIQLHLTSYIVHVYIDWRLCHNVLTVTEWSLLPLWDSLSLSQCGEIIYLVDISNRRVRGTSSVVQPCECVAPVLVLRFGSLLRSYRFAKPLFNSGCHKLQDTPNLRCFVSRAVQTTSSLWDWSLLFLVIQPKMM